MHTAVPHGRNSVPENRSGDRPVAESTRAFQFLVAAVAAACLLLMFGCATQPPYRDQAGIVIANASGTLDKQQSEAIMETMSKQSGYPDLQHLAERISSLSELPLYRDNRVELLIDGPETYRSMQADIERARHYILFEIYTFSDDDTGRKFAELLTAKSTDGVDVKIIYDSMGSFYSEEGFFDQMEESGIELLEFNAINPVDGGNPFNLNVRDHRKLLVVDGTVAYTGGVNVSGTYSSGSDSTRKRDPVKDGWRDTHVSIRGPAVRGFEQKFVDNWRGLGGRIALPELTTTSADPAGEAVVGIVAAKGGDEEESEIFSAYLDAVQVARERVWITQAYFAPDDRFIELMLEAAQRGVDVRILVPGLSDSALVLNASRSRYGKLLRGGIRIYETQDTMLHAKTAVIDGIWSTVGSSNLDYRSFLHNDEINAVILGRAFAHEMERQFREDIAKAREIRSEEWEQRSWWRKLKEKLSWVAKYWI